jgi:hypothetical protein
MLPSQDLDTSSRRTADSLTARVISISGRAPNPFLVIVFMILGIAAGIYALYQTPLDF